MDACPIFRRNPRSHGFGMAPLMTVIWPIPEASRQAEAIPSIAAFVAVSPAVTVNPQGVPLAALGDRAVKPSPMASSGMAPTNFRKTGS